MACTSFASRYFIAAMRVVLLPFAAAFLLLACGERTGIGNRFICGPANDWDRVFYTYDTKSGLLLASSNHARPHRYSHQRGNRRWPSGGRLHEAVQAVVDLPPG